MSQTVIRVEDLYAVEAQQRSDVIEIRPDSNILLDDFIVLNTTILNGFLLTLLPGTLLHCEQ